MKLANSTTFDAGGARLTDVSDPSSSQDAATKAYVDAHSGATLPANAAGWLHDDGLGGLSWSTPTKSDVGLGSVTNDAQTKAAVVPNTAPSAGQILAGNVGGTAYAPVSVASPFALSSAGALTVVADVPFASHKITGLADPAALQDAATKNYVDQVAGGLEARSARLATAAALPTNTYNNGVAGVGATLTATANAALTVDGTSVAVGDRVLIKNEATAANNGLYGVAATGSGTLPYILTRTLDADDANDFASQLVLVTAGSANADTSWICTAGASVTVGTTALNYTQYQVGQGTAVGGDLTGTVGNATIAAGAVTPTKTTDLRARLTADVTNATATLANLTDLSVTLVAGKKYVGRLILKCNNSVAAEGIQLDFNGGSATMTSFWAAGGQAAGGTNVTGTLISTSLAGVINFTTITGETLIIIALSFVCNAGGTFIPRQAENTHSSGTLTVELGSNLVLENTPN